MESRILIPDSPQHSQHPLPKTTRLHLLLIYFPETGVTMSSSCPSNATICLSNQKEKPDAPHQNLSNEMSYVLNSPDGVWSLNACQPLHLTQISLEIEPSSESNTNQTLLPLPACLPARPPSHCDQMMFPKKMPSVSHVLFISDKFWPLNACQKLSSSPQSGQRPRTRTRVGLQP